jgi:hypothetical protein
MVARGVVGRVWASVGATASAARTNTNC